MLSHVDRIVERLCGRMDTIAAGGGPVDLRVHHMLVEHVTFRVSAVQHYTQSLDDLLAGIRPMLVAVQSRLPICESGGCAPALPETSGGARAGPTRRPRAGHFSSRALPP